MEFFYGLLFFFIFLILIYIFFNFCYIWYVKKKARFYLDVLNYIKYFREQDKKNK